MTIPSELRAEAEQMVSMYRQAAAAGLPIAQVELGWLLDKGVGAPRDNAEAVMWFKKAAEQVSGRAVCQISATVIAARLCGPPLT